MSRELGRRVAAAHDGASQARRHRGPFPALRTACEAGSRPHGIAGCGCCAARRRKAQPMAKRSLDLSRRHRNLIRHSNTARKDDKRGTGTSNDVLIAASGDLAAIVPQPAREEGESRAADAIEYGATRQVSGHSASTPERAAGSLEVTVDSESPDRLSGGPVNVPTALDLDHTRQLRPRAFIGAKAERCLIRGRRIDNAIWRSETKFARIGYLAIATGYLMAPEQIYDLHRQVHQVGMDGIGRLTVGQPAGVAAVDIAPAESCRHFEQVAAR
jgi:hypothetical protein